MQNIKRSLHFQGIGILGDLKHVVRLRSTTSAREIEQNTVSDPQFVTQTPANCVPKRFYMCSLLLQSASAGLQRAFGEFGVEAHTSLRIPRSANEDFSCGQVSCRETRKQFVIFSINT
ncbi:hypothetical protein L596_027677 [Steinernema carpocapsae]|uniref:Uncharacterized protein n=1 Tax=Steinernema carpocapsae TaxID=34508 RepID=A0A4U5LW51_STECR|nr:hypothetical protein L596_027677 [Steinernema carpocapsae]